MGKSKIIKSSVGHIRYDMNHFINLVRREDVLWNRNCSKFLQREKREVAWAQIARCLYKAFDKLHEFEKREIIEVLMKRWKNARDSFLRAHRLKAGDNPYASSYIYDQELQFLLTDGRDSVTPVTTAVAHTLPSTEKSTRKRKTQRTKPMAKSNSASGSRKRTKHATATSTAKKTGRNGAERASSLDIYETISLNDDEDNDDVNGDCVNAADVCFDDSDGDDVEDVVIVKKTINERDSNECPLLVPQLKMLLNTSTTTPTSTTTTTSTNSKNNGLVGAIIAHTHTQAALEQLKDDVMSASNGGRRSSTTTTTNNTTSMGTSNGNAVTQQNADTNGGTMYEYVLPAPSNALGSDTTDPDLAFFASIVPVVRTMDVSQKLDFQIEVLKLLKNFRGN